MSASSAPTIEKLATWSTRLRSQADQAHDSTVDEADQLAIENTIAEGIAILAGEALPEPATEPSGRPILARDLLITTDLVLRALRAA